MAGTKTGSPSIWKHSLKIYRLATKYGATDLDLITTSGVVYGDCVRALMACVAEILLNDDFVLQVDRHNPAGPEDIIGP